MRKAREVKVGQPTIKTWEVRILNHTDLIISNHRKGSVNIYGLDSYPGGLSCTNINSGFNLVRNYYQWFQNYSYTQPEYWPEFESGFYQPWGGFWYDECLAGKYFLTRMR